MKRLVLLSVIATLAIFGASNATAKPILNLDIHHGQTNAIPGGSPGQTGVSTSIAGSASVSEVQKINVYATTGQFRLHFGAEITTNLPYNASTVEVQAALRALPSIGSPNVNVGFETGRYVVTFTGALAKTDVPQITVSDGTTRLGIDPEYWFDVDNVGDTATSGSVTLTVTLPAGIRRNSVRNANHLDETNWSCPGSPGDAVITCTSSVPIARHSGSRGLALLVDLDPVKLVPGTERIVKATVSGGGAAGAPPAAACAPGFAACAVDTIHIATEPAGFGLIPETFLPEFLRTDGVTPERQAGAHPDHLTVPFDFNTIEAPEDRNIFQKNEADSVRDLTVDLPPGFIGNPSAVGECSAAGLSTNDCPPSSQVGLAYVKTPSPISTPAPGQSFEPWYRPVYNMSHPRGAVADLAFVVASNPIHIKVSLDPANHYAIRSVVSNINETVPPFHQRLTIWGVPSDHSHDSERCDKGNTAVINTKEECSTDFAQQAFITEPAQCESDNTFRLHHYDSWQETGVFGPEIDYTLPGKFEHCERPRFEPKVEIEPTGKQANTPTGLDVHVKIAQNENPDALAAPPVKRFTVRLPEGMSFSPSFADGLKSCTLAQMKLGTNEEVQCPDASRIGEVTLHSPLLPKALEGSMYLAAQGDNPFGSTFALLLVLKDVEERGILVKIPGRIDVDETTGQITTVFDDAPQFPFDDLTLKFRSGPRAPLVSPPTCGMQTIGVEVASYAQPQNPVDASNVYDVTEGPNGTPCPPDAVHRSFAPKFSGGTLNPVAGAYSPFLFRLSREDSEQELSQVTTVLPPGLVAKIAGVPFCPDQAITSISTELGAGAAEAAHPACPAASQIGTVSAGLGAGPAPNYFPGKVYLAGPYKGAPLSLAVVAPGLAGPFDLGNVVVRAALYVNPENAQVKAVSDPFPTILHGVILRTRDVRLRVDRAQTTINPTNCSPMSLNGVVSGAGGALFNAASPFQVGSCSDLSFKPKLDFHLFGGTHRGSHPKFRATLTMPPGGANIAAASVALPHSEFLDQGHIGTVCTRVQFAAGAGNGAQCPAASVYGAVSAKTPLLDETLTGNVYLRSSSHELPDLVAVLNGKITAVVSGRVDSVNGGIRNTFETVPDAPVESFTLTLAGGNKGLLVNSRDICKAPAKATAKFTGQNGAKITLHPGLKSACAKAKKKNKKAAKHKRAQH
jgi:hypothetical protein